MKKNLINILFLVILLPLFAFAKGYKQNKPSLVLVLVYDQLRADLLMQKQNLFLPALQNGKIGGFNYLIEQGAYFPFTEYENMQCMTCPGHAMILTGSYPYNNGIPLNEYWNSAKEKIEPCTFDEQHTFSPTKLKTSTVGDHLKMSNNQSKVVAMSLKERSGIMLGGHSADIVYWLNSKEMSWETSTYYNPEKKNPAWLEKLNLNQQKFKNTKIEFKPKYTKANFSHTASSEDDTSLGFFFGTDLQTEFAKILLKEMDLGSDETTDLFAVSFSTHDVSGHNYGPDSDELLEIAIHEDRKLSEFLQFIDKNIKGGIENALIVLTSDHGASPTVEKSKSVRLSAGTIDQKEVLKKLNKSLESEFGSLKSDYVKNYKSLNFYFSEEALKQKNKDQYFEHAKKFLLTQDGISIAFSETDYIENKLPQGIYRNQILKTYIPKSSGHVVAIPKPYWFELNKPATHVTGYSYDRTVPLVFAGKNIKSGAYPEGARIVDIAPTLSYLLGLIPPAMNEGKVLSNAITP